MDELQKRNALRQEKKEELKSKAIEWVGLIVIVGSMGAFLYSLDGEWGSDNRGNCTGSGYTKVCD
ncbi:hypothetical protein [Kiloniella majae]|uniref:hypothetical protein n=1 Tax=Kiloniella majae TaxID=1938558 RepID=UPI000F7B2B6A|nr:hypothetical protein [Kiloniella majae]